MTEEKGAEPGMFKAIFDNANDVIIVLDTEGRIVLFNPKAQSFFDPSENIRGKKLSASGIFDEKTGKVVNDLIRSTLDHGAIEKELESWSRKGKKSWFRISTAVIKNGGGGHSGIILNMVDISDIKATSEDLLEKEEKYRATVEQSAENIYIYDIETHEIIESNRALQDLLGYTADEMRNLKASDFIAHTEEDIGSKIQDILRNGHGFVGERSYKRKDGSLVDVEVSGSHITQGKRSMLCIVSRDITERKRYQEQLIEEKNRAEFYLDLLAHDMGNLLHGIQNGLSAFEMVRGDPERESNLFTMVRSLADRSTRLANNVITFSQIRESEPQPEVLRLRELVENAFKKARDYFPGLFVDLSNEIGENMYFKGERLLEDALYNLFHNSIKVQERGRPVIGVSATNGHGRIRIEVWDHGGGISEEIKDSLFNRYSDIGKKRHTGIGMTVVHMVVARHGGTIEVSDRLEEGMLKGTTFILDLPNEI